MDALMVILFLILLAIGFLWSIRHQREVSWWLSTPRYNRKYKIKMLKRSIEDAQDDLDYELSREKNRKRQQELEEELEAIENDEAPED